MDANPASRMHHARRFVFRPSSAKSDARVLDVPTAATRRPSVRCPARVLIARRRPRRRGRPPRPRERPSRRFDDPPTRGCFTASAADSRARGRCYCLRPRPARAARTGRRRRHRDVSQGKRRFRRHRQRVGRHRERSRRVFLSPLAPRVPRVLRVPRRASASSSFSVSPPTAPPRSPATESRHLADAPSPSLTVFRDQSPHLTQPFVDRRVWGPA